MTCCLPDSKKTQWPGQSQVDGIHLCGTCRHAQNVHSHKQGLNQLSKNTAKSSQSRHDLHATEHTKSMIHKGNLRKNGKYWFLVDNK